MVREFKILVDIWGPPDKEGKSKIIKKNILKRKSINLHDITSIVKDYRDWETDRKSVV